MVEVRAVPERDAGLRATDGQEDDGLQEGLTAELRFTLPLNALATIRPTVNADEELAPEATVWAYGVATIPSACDVVTSTE
jgi:hypothetical protein